MKLGLSDSAVRRIARRITMAIEDVIFLPVDSSNVQEIGFDDEEYVLYVRFLAKGNSPSSLYAYYEVSPDIWDSFIMAPSKGKFIWSHLRDRYAYERLE